MKQRKDMINDGIKIRKESKCKLRRKNTETNTGHIQERTKGRRKERQKKGRKKKERKKGKGDGKKEEN